MTTLTLALECSTSRGSVALAETGEGAGEVRFLWQEEFPAGRGEGGKLFTALENTLRAARAAGGPLAEIVVGLGPGSYSGVRQAIAAATGLALATGARLTGYPSTAALPGTPRRYLAVGDARRGTLYHTAVEDGVCVAGPELLADLAAWERCVAARPDWPVVAVDSVPEGLPPETPVGLPSAEALARSEAARRWLPPLEPIYLRAVTVTLPKGK